MDYDKIVKEKIYLIFGSLREPWMTDGDFSELVEDSVEFSGGWGIYCLMFKRGIELGGDIDQMTLFIKSCFDEILYNKLKQ